LGVMYSIVAVMCEEKSGHSETNAPSKEVLYPTVHSLFTATQIAAADLVSWLATLP